MTDERCQGCGRSVGDARPTATGGCCGHHREAPETVMDFPFVDPMGARKTLRLTGSFFPCAVCGLPVEPSACDCAHENARDDRADDLSRWKALGHTKWAARVEVLDR